MASIPASVISEEEDPQATERLADERLRREKDLLRRKLQEDSLNDSSREVSRDSSFVSPISRSMSITGTVSGPAIAIRPQSVESHSSMRLDSIESSNGSAGTGTGAGAGGTGTAAVPSAPSAPTAGATNPAAGTSNPAVSISGPGPTPPSPSRPPSAMKHGSRRLRSSTTSSATSATPAVDEESDEMSSHSSMSIADLERETVDLSKRSYESEAAPSGIKPTIKPITLRNAASTRLEPMDEVGPPSTSSIVSVDLNETHTHNPMRKARGVSFSEDTKPGRKVEQMEMSHRKTSGEKTPMCPCCVIA